MSSDWPIVQIADCVELTSGFPFKSTDYTDAPDAVRLLRGDNIGQGLLRWDGAKKWPIEKCGHLPEYELKEMDIVLAMDRPWIPSGLKFGKVRKVDLPAYLVQRVARLRPTQRIRADYLYYVISSQEFTEYIQSVTTGTAVPHISSKQIKEFKFKLPDMLTQLGIGEFLSSLDDRIALIRDTNSTLEAIAHALFKSWFVDFDAVRAKQEGREPEGMDADTAALFPDSFVESELGCVPKGWQVGNFNTFLSETSKRVGTSEATVLSAVQSGELVKSSEHFNKKVHSDSIVNYKAVPPFSYAYNPSRINIGSIGLNEFYFTGAVSPVYVVATANNREGSYYIWHQLRRKAVREWIKTLCSGTVRQSLSFKDFASIPLIIPPHEVLSAFLEIRDSVFLAISEKEKQSTFLIEIRDTLLPLLISGRLRLPDAEALVDETTACST